MERVTGNVWWSWWAPTIGQASLDPATAPQVPDSDVVITNDELACLLRVGRIDYWLAPDATSLERFSLVTPRGRRGMYGGAVAILSADEIGRVVERASPRRVSVVLFRSGKFGFDPDRVYAVGPAIVIDRSAAEDWALVRLSSMTQTR